MSQLFSFYSWKYVVYHFFKGVLLSWILKVKNKKSCAYFKLYKFLTTDPFGFSSMVQMWLPILHLLSSVGQERWVVLKLGLWIIYNNQNSPEFFKQSYYLMGVMKRAVKWTSTDVDKRRPSTLLEKCSLFDVDQEKCSGVNVDRRRSTFIK